MDASTLELDGPQPMPDFYRMGHLKHLKWTNCGYEIVAHVLSNKFLASRLISLDLSRSDCDLKHALQFNTFRTLTGGKFTPFRELSAIYLKGAINMDDAFWEWFLKYMVNAKIHKKNKKSTTLKVNLFLEVDLSCTGMRNFDVPTPITIKRLNISHNFLNNIQKRTIRNIHHLTYLNISFNEFKNDDLRRLLPFTNRIKFIVDPQRMHYIKPSTVQEFAHKSVFEINPTIVQDVKESKQSPFERMREQTDEQMALYSSDEETHRRLRAFRGILLGRVETEKQREAGLYQYNDDSDEENDDFSDIPNQSNMRELIVTITNEANMKYVKGLSLEKISLYFGPELHLSKKFGTQLANLPKLRVIILTKYFHAPPIGMAGFLIALFQSKSLATIYGNFNKELFTPSNKAKVIKALKQNNTVIITNHTEDDMENEDGIETPQQPSIFDAPDMQEHFRKVEQQRQRLRQILPIIAALQLTKGEQKEVNQMMTQVSHPHSESIIDVMPQISAFMGDEPLSRSAYSAIASQVTTHQQDTKMEPTRKRPLPMQELPMVFAESVHLWENDQLLGKYPRSTDAIEYIIRHGNKRRTYKIQTQLDTYEYQFVDNKWQRTANIMIE